MIVNNLKKGKIIECNTYHNCKTNVTIKLELQEVKDNFLPCCLSFFDFFVETNITFIVFHCV